ncbi:hypothetical protein [Actinopolymorpha alba]|uniref:hypothetical protein n=1 Tax=Actinopolymorpha alba TaxID=533267 RepID=UPI00036E28E8|nr:hypothetical protein [Actinopolymorpha alba]
MGRAKPAVVTAVASVLFGGLTTLVAAEVFDWGIWLCTASGKLTTCVREGYGPRHLALAAGVAGLVALLCAAVCGRPRLLFGVLAGAAYRRSLAAGVLIAGFVGFVAGRGAVDALRWLRWRCDGEGQDGVCPDGSEYALPFLLVGAVAGGLALAVVIILVARPLEVTERAALAVDVTRLAGVPMLPTGCAALAIFVAEGVLPLLAAAVLLFVAGIGPAQARRVGQRGFIGTCLVLAVTAIVVAVPAILIAPLLAGYAILLVAAAVVALRAPVSTRPYGKLTNRREAALPAATANG